MGLVPLLITQEVICNLLLVLELSVANLRATCLLILHLLLLLDCMEADARDLDWKVFQCALILSALPILPEYLVAELPDRDALDASIFIVITVGARICLLQIHHTGFGLIWFLIVS